METKKTVASQPITNISYNLLVQKLLGINGTTFVRLDTRTIPDMRKTNNPFYGRIVKDSTVLAMIGAEYKNVVNNKRVKESMLDVRDSLMSCLGMSAEQAYKYLESLEDYAETNRANFEPKPRKWGEHMTDEKGRTSRTMVVHTNKKNETNHYVQVWILDTKTPVYRYADSMEEVSEQDLESIKSFLSKKYSNAEHQGVKAENEIIIRSYKVQSLRQIRLNKTEYVVKDDAKQGEIEPSQTINVQTA